MEKDSKIAQGLAWKLLERFGVQGVQFLLQLLLARILDPEHYGTLSLMIIFTNLANVFIQRGFNTALVQNKDVTEEDYSSVFWVTMSVATLLYGVIFFCAPVIERFYEMSNLVSPLRVMGLVLFPGALNSIQLAITNRNMDFQKVFRSNVSAIMIAGVTGVVLALCGAGLWTLVIQNLLNTTIACVVMWFSVGWRPKLLFNWNRVLVLFSYGWKLLVSGLIDTLYQDLTGLVIGKKYNADMLAYNSRGQQFPSFVITAINNSVQSVLLPAMSAEQDDRNKVKTLMRNSVMFSSYIIFPLMAGLAAVATPMVRLLLTEKWLPCVPFLQVACLTFAFYPVHTSNLQAINAMGRSDIFLKLEVVKKIAGIAILTFAVFCFESPLAIAIASAGTSVICTFINAYPNKKLINYSYLEQVKDIFPSFVISLVMFGIVMTVELLGMHDIITLVLQVAVGVITYILLSAIFRLEPYKLLLEQAKALLKNRNTNKH